MAFKRDGDSADWLNLLQKRRVSELFAENVPEDEAILTKNGRFCCIACSNKPIFDTAETLSIHRSGKKHQLYSENFFRNKQEIADIIEKRNHEQYLKTGKVDGSRTSGKRTITHGMNSVLGAKTYDPSVKRPKLKPDSRKPTLDLEEKCTSGTIRTIADYRKECSLSLQANVESVKPYVSKRTSKEHSDTKPNLTVPNRIFSSDRGSAKCTRTEINSRTPVPFSNAKAISVEPKFNKQSKCKTKSKSSKEELSTTVVSHRSQMKDTSKAELYLQALGSGWKKSRDGTWIKDEEAEFDSDEEPPNL